VKKLIVGLFIFAVTAQVGAQTVTAAEQRFNLFSGVQKFCMLKFLSSTQLTSSVLRSGSWSISHVCECASALTVSKVKDTDLAEAATPEHTGVLNQELSTNISSCVHMQS
jgi:hypothetical protein